MATRSSMRITSDTLTPNLRLLAPKVKIAVDSIMEYWATRAGSDMRANAKWQDQTGNARQGLNAEVVSDLASTALVLYHTMPYGIYLEVRWSGRYAIIGPTLNEIAPQVAAMLATAILRLR